MYLYCEKKKTNYEKLSKNTFKEDGKGKYLVSFYATKYYSTFFFFASLNEQLCLQVNLALECFIFTADKL